MPMVAVPRIPVVVFLLLLYSPFVPANEPIKKASVVYDSSGHLTFQPGIVGNESAAYGTFSDDIETTGWGQLNIKAGYGATRYSDYQLMYAAGYLEGAMTAKRIAQHYQNVVSQILPDKEMAAKVRVWFEEQEKWMVEMIEANKEDSFWRQVGLVYGQFKGIIEGYQKHGSNDEVLDDFAFQVINGYGDLLDIPKAINRSLLSDWKNMSLSEIRDEVNEQSHCSVLIKVLPGYEDILVSHSTWFSYSLMLRIYKHYDINLQDPAAAAKGVSFSSYPGCLVSLDDFYIMTSGLVMLQTTNGLWNDSLYDLVTPHSLLAWHRVKVANTMADTSQMWTDIVSKFNSGTYNNQYMLLDLKKIRLGVSIEDGTFRVAEQIPGLVVSGDVTPLLREGHWASYNVPFWEKIYNESGYVPFVEKYGVEFSYELAPRAKIFRRDADKVTSLDSLKYLLRYNNYKNEYYADNSSCSTICCRGDLESPAKAFGCYDTKVTNYSMALSRIAEGVSSPTMQGGLAPFSWEKFSNISHLGMPNSWNFEFIQMQPNKDLD